MAAPPVAHGAKNGSLEYLSMLSTVMSGGCLRAQSNCYINVVNSLAASLPAPSHPLSSFLRACVHACAGCMFVL